MSSFLRNLSALSLVTIFSLSACSSVPKPEVPLQLQQAGRHNLAGVAAESKGRFKVAESEFQEAYRLYGSVEDYRGMVTALINSSRLYRRLNDVRKVEGVVSQAAKLVQEVPALDGEVSFERCKLAQMKGDTAVALAWAERGVKTSGEADAARMLNLLAAVQLQVGDLPGGAATAERALKSAVRQSDRREEANARRILGEIAIRQGRQSDASSLLEAALALDKELALPGRVGDDLAVLSNLAVARNEINGAIEYLQRSIDVSIAGRNFKAAAERLDQLVALYRRSGNSEAAERAADLKKSLEQAKVE